MSEQDDNRKAQSEALGRALAEAMDGDRLHPDNQPQVGTRLDAMCDVCGRAFAEHRSGLLNEAYCPRFIEAHWCGWLPTTFVPQPTPAEPRIETVPDERAQEQNDWNKLLLEIARLYALIDDEWADADIGEMDEFDPWHALRELTKRMVGAQPEPEERAEFEKFWGRVEFDDWPIDWKKAKKIWDAAQQSLKDAPTEEETVWVIEHSAHGGEWRPVGCIFYNSPNAENDARRQLAYLNNNGHKDFAVRVSRYERSNGRARAGSSLSRAALAEWFFNNESEEQEADDRKHRQREQKYARWPEDAAIQPYCRWAWRRADAFIAHFERASPPSSPGAAERSDQDYAIEHGEYLAKAAEFLLNSINEENRLQVEADPDRDEEIIDNARETRNDAWKGLNSAIYEFRKRAKRCSPGAPQEQK